MKLSRNEILGERDARCGVREHLRSFAFLPRAEKQWRTIPNNLGPRRKFRNRSTRWIRKIDPLFLFDRQNGSQMYRKKERELLNEKFRRRLCARIKKESVVERKTEVFSPIGTIPHGRRGMACEGHCLSLDFNFLNVMFKFLKKGKMHSSEGTQCN